MKRYEAVLYGRVQTGADKLGKPVCERLELGRVSVRRAPWNRSRIDAAGNAADVVRRTYFTAAPRSSLEGVSELEAEGEAWRVVNVSDEGRGCAVSVERPKP